MRRGIDVSVHQSKINWQKVKADGIDFVMVKATQGTSESNPSNYLFTDSTFKYNITEAKKYGLDCGVYHYLTATTVAKAKEEAKYFLQVIEPYRSLINLYVAVDVESKYLPTNKQLLTQITNVFCQAIQAKGYEPIVYTNPNFLKNRLNDVSAWKLWLALWRDKNNVPTVAQYPNLTLWQWGLEPINGIDKDGVDANFEITPKENQIIQEEIKEEEDMDLKKFEELFYQMREGLQDNDANEWSEAARTWALSTGLIVGNGATVEGEPNCMWADFLNREQLIMVLYRFAQMMGKA